MVFFHGYVFFQSCVTCRVTGALLTLYVLFTNNFNEVQILNVE